jgi:hypothetical protein
MKVTHALANRGQEKTAIPLNLFCSTPVREHFMAEHSELARDMKRAGINFPDTCPLMFMGVPGVAQTEFAVTNSNKTRVYSNSRFFKDADLLEIVITGKIPKDADYEAVPPAEAPAAGGRKQIKLNQA